MLNPDFPLELFSSPQDASEQDAESAREKAKIYAST
jgi:hypothetical protein